MRFLKFCLILSPWLAFGSWQAQTEDEALFLRRIADFWEEGEYMVAKNQIEEFLAVYPQSAFADTLRSAAGDLLLREKNYSAALERYAQISEPQAQDRAFLNRMQCLYHLGWYATLADETEECLKGEKQLDEKQKLEATYFLAIALYQQCLNFAKEPQSLNRLAERARPYFETLFESELSSEVAQAFAHLSCILKDYPKASRIFLDQAKKHPEAEEELLFQAAVIQAEYDKDVAIGTFSEIAKMGKTKCKEAAYNSLVLSFDAGRFDQLVNAKEDLLKQIPDERRGLAHFFIGRSFLALKKYQEALLEFESYLSSEPETSSEFQRNALLSLIEASFHGENIDSLNRALTQFSTLFPSDPELANIRFTQGQALKKTGQIGAARQNFETILAEFPLFSRKAEVAFELIQIDYQEKKWESCAQNADDFLKTYPQQTDLTAYAWRYLISSLVEKGEKEQLISSLETLEKDEVLFTESERCDWKFLLAKTLFEMKRYDPAIEILQHLLEGEKSFLQKANAKLLLAYCYRDGKEDFSAFSTLAEEALQQKATLVEAGPIHAALFNSYLALSRLQPDVLAKAENHLFEAFCSNGAVEKQNLLWLADRYEFNHPDRAAKLLDFCMKLPEEAPLSSESLMWKRAKIHKKAGQYDAAIELLKNLTARYTDSSIEWALQNEVKFLLAENLIAAHNTEEGIEKLEEIMADSPSLRNETCAAASLLRAKLRAAKWREDRSKSEERNKAIIEFKNLFLQRALANEPIYLEAALEYVELQADSEPTVKELSLLLKTKGDFESASDLLSKDYSESRSKLPEKNRIYEGYMKWIEARILILKSELHEPCESQTQLRVKAKELLLQIVSDPAHPILLERARLQLEKVSDVPAAQSAP